jgi:hypothetical protein
MQDCAGCDVESGWRKGFGLVGSMHGPGTLRVGDRGPAASSSRACAAVSNCLLACARAKPDGSGSQTADLSRSPRDRPGKGDRDGSTWRTCSPIFLCASLALNSKEDQLANFGLTRRVARVDATITRRLSKRAKTAKAPKRLREGVQRAQPAS